MDAPHGFYVAREFPDYGVSLFLDRPRGLLNYVNLPPLCGMIISSGLATLTELQSEYGVRDAFDLVEVISVDAFNRREITRHADHH